MRVAITGGFGFVGHKLATTLLERGTLRGQPIDELVLADVVTRADDPLTGQVRVVTGDLLDTADELFAEPVDVLVHLAAAVSGACEADFDLGMRANLDTTRALLERARRQTEQGTTPLVLFSSSVAVFGPDPSLPLPSVVDESTLPTPQSSYGIQKFCCEQLVADHTRKGHLDGRIARLMTVAIRPGKPNAAASGFLSGIVREPLAGIEAVCPVSPDLEVALASPDKTIEGLLTVAEAPEWNRRIALNLPALTVRVSEMLDTLRQVAGDEVADRVTVAPDPAIEAIVGSWPSRFDNTEAARLGLHPDADFASVVRQFMALG